MIGILLAGDKKASVSSGISLLGSSQNGGQNITSLNVSVPSGMTIGSLLYAVFVCDDTAATPALTSSGWTRHTYLNFNTNNDYGYVGAFYKFATASEPTSYTFSGSTVTAMSIGIMAFSGVNSSNPFGGVTPVTKKATSAASAVFPAINTTASGYILATAAQGGNYSSAVSNAFTWGSGYTSVMANISQYNKQAQYDAECIFSGLSNTALNPGTITPPPGTWQKAYAMGLINTFLLPA